MNDRGVVPVLGVTDICEAKIVLLGPEEWHGVKPLLSSKDIARRGLPWRSATTQCSTRMRSPVSRSGQRGECVVHWISFGMIRPSNKLGLSCLTPH